MAHPEDVERNGFQPLQIFLHQFGVVVGATAVRVGNHDHHNNKSRLMLAGQYRALRCRGNRNADTFSGDTGIGPCSARFLPAAEISVIVYELHKA